MELTEKKIREYKEICCLSEIREETADAIIPDLFPDITEVINTFAVCSVNEKSVMPGVVRAGGKIQAVIFYDGDGTEKGYRFKTEFPFSQSYEYVGARPDDKLIFSSQITEQDCEIINSRKIRIRVKTKAVVKLMREEESAVSEGVENAEEYGMNTLTKAIDKYTCSDAIVKQIAFTEEIRLADDADAKEARLVRWECVWSKNDLKISDGKAVLRGVAEVCAFFADESFDTFKRNVYTIPFSNTFECDILENDISDVLISQNKCNLSVVEKEDGTIVLVCDLSASASLRVYRKIEANVLCDAYSTLYESTCKEKKCSCVKEISPFSESLTKDIRTEDGEGVLRVIDSYSSAYLSEERELFKICAVTYFIYADLSGKIKRVKVYSELNSPVPDGYVPGSGMVSADKTAVKYDPNGISAALSLTLCGKTAVYDEFTCLSEVSADTSQKRKPKTKGNLVLKRLGKGETLWDAAKEYGTTKSSVLAANNMLSESEATDGKLIMIPFVK